MPIVGERASATAGARSPRCCAYNARRPHDASRTSPRTAFDEPASSRDPDPSHATTSPAHRKARPSIFPIKRDTATAGGCCPSSSITAHRRPSRVSRRRIAAPGRADSTIDSDHVIRAVTDATAPGQIENLGSWASLDDGDACIDATLHDARASRQATSKVAVLMAVRTAELREERPRRHREAAKITDSALPG
jgi:hypothetical protein